MGSASGEVYMVALYPGGPRSRGPRGVGGAEDCEVTAERADVGVKVRSAELVCWLMEGGELKDEEDPERLDTDIAMFRKLFGQGFGRAGSSFSGSRFVKRARLVAVVAAVTVACTCT